MARSLVLLLSTAALATAADDMFDPEKDGKLVPGCGCDLESCCFGGVDVDVTKRFACSLITDMPEFPTMCADAKSGKRDNGTSVCDLEEVKSGPLRALFLVEATSKYGPPACLQHDQNKEAAAAGLAPEMVMSMCSYVDEKDDLGRGQGTISMDDWTWGEVKDGKLSRDNADLKWFDNQLCASVFANCDTETGGIYMSMGTECRQSATVPIVFFGPETAIGGNGRMGACNIFEPTDPSKRPDYGDDVVYDPKGNYSITVLVTGKFPCDPPLVHNKKSDGASATTASLVVGALALVLALA